MNPKNSGHDLHITSQQAQGFAFVGKRLIKRNHFENKTKTFSNYISLPLCNFFHFVEIFGCVIFLGDMARKYSSPLLTIILFTNHFFKFTFLQNNNLSKKFLQLGQPCRSDVSDRNVLRLEGQHFNMTRACVRTHVVEVYYLAQPRSIQLNDKVGQSYYPAKIFHSKGIFWLTLVKIQEITSLSFEDLREMGNLRGHIEGTLDTALRKLRLRQNESQQFAE